MTDIDTYDPATLYDGTAAKYAAAARKYWGPAADRLVELAGVAAGQMVLDVACGPGPVTLRAAERVAPGGWVLGVDLSRGMLAEAQAEALRAGVANVGFCPGDFHHLVMTTADFDAVLCGFAIFFAKDHPEVLRRLWALVGPGGVLAVSSFTAEFFSPLFDVYCDAVRAHSSVDPTPFLTSRPIESLAAFSHLFRQTRIVDVAITTEITPVAVPTPAAWWEIADATGIHRIDQELSAEEAELVHGEVDAYIAADGVTTVDLGVHYAVGRKPT